MLNKVVEKLEVFLLDDGFYAFLVGQQTESFWAENTWNFAAATTTALYCQLFSFPVQHDVERTKGSCSTKRKHPKRPKSTEMGKY